MGRNLLASVFRESSARSSPPEAPAAPAVDYAKVIGDLAAQATELAREAAQMCGSIDDVAGVARHEITAFESLFNEVGTIIDANSAIAAAVEESQGAAQAANAAVERVAADVTAALDSLRDVGQFADGITRIALQTRLVAFNAAVEAKHAGAAGRGFAVVAEAVKDLAQKVEASSKTIGKTVEQLNQRIGELSRNVRESGTLADGHPTFHRAFERVVASGAQIAEATERNQQSCGATRVSLTAMKDQVQETSRALQDARGRVESFLKASEYLTQMSADCGASTVDTPYIELVVAESARVSALFEEGVAAGRITLADLFDEDYRPIAGSQPQQHMTRYVGFTDSVLPAVQEAVLGFSGKIVFCAAVDRNGFLPTHNRKFSHPQGGDPVWNAAHCRNRRIFNDRTGLAAGRNQHRFLLQTYRRDMGGGEFKLMKDVSAPILVQGRHWGGLRIAYSY